MLCLYFTIPQHIVAELMEDANNSCEAFPTATQTGYFYIFTVFHLTAKWSK